MTYTKDRILQQVYMLVLIRVRLEGFLMMGKSLGECLIRNKTTPFYVIKK